MAIARQQVGQPQEYKGRTILLRYAGPDLLCYVDNDELPNFYESMDAGYKAGRKYIDQQEAERKK